MAPPTGNSSSGLVEDRRVRAGRAQEDDAVEVGHRLDELGRLVRVARVEHGRAVHRAEGGEVLERHLRWPVLADRDARVRAAELDVRAADRGHPDEVVGAREERGERRGERLPAAHLEPDRGGDHLLLGDVHLEVPLRMRLAEDLRVGRVRDLAVERDDVLARVAERLERVAVRLARRDLVAADLVARQLDRSAAARRDVRPLTLGLRDLDHDVADPAQLLDRLLGVVERLAVAAVLVLDRLHALALDRLRDDHGRQAGRLLGLG